MSIISHFKNSLAIIFQNLGPCPPFMLPPPFEWMRKVCPYPRYNHMGDTKSSLSQGGLHVSSLFRLFTKSPITYDAVHIFIANVINFLNLVHKFREFRNYQILGKSSPYQQQIFFDAPEIIKMMQRAFCMSK